MTVILGFVGRELMVTFRTSELSAKQPKTSLTFTLKMPEAMIITSKIEHSAIYLSVRPYCTPENVSTVISEVNESLKVVFEKNNIKPAIPTRIIHNISV